MCPFAKFGLWAVGLAYKQLDSDTNFICLLPHPVPVRSPVTPSCYERFFFSYIYTACSSSEASIGNGSRLAQQNLSNTIPRGKIWPRQKKMLLLLFGTRFNCSGNTDIG